jgi:OHCU decarboxylase
VPNSPRTLTHLNGCTAEEFVAAVGPIFEHSPWIAAAVVPLRPFASREALHAALCEVVRAAGEERQLALIRAHPDLVGREVKARTGLTAESSREQAAAGLMDLTPDDIARFDRYNTAYKARFGFPFVICARRIDRSRSSLDPDVRKGVHGGTVELDGGRLRLRVLLDRSMLEAYVNGTNSITSRVYPTRKDAAGLRLSAEGGSSRVVELDVWRMNGAYDTPVAPAVYDPPRPTDVDALPNHDFATGDLTGWTVVSGTTFSDANVTTRSDWGWGGPFYQADTGSDGGHHLWGFNPDAGGDDATGVLRSATVVLGGDGLVDLLVSGGNDPDRLYAAAVRASDGKILAKATGRGGEQYRRVVFDLADHIGEQIYIEIVDKATGGWGHINVDDVNVPVRRR